MAWWLSLVLGVVASKEAAHEKFNVHDVVKYGELLVSDSLVPLKSHIALAQDMVLGPGLLSRRPHGGVYAGYRMPEDAGGPYRTPGSLLQKYASKWVGDEYHTNQPRAVRTAAVFDADRSFSGKVSINHSGFKIAGEARGIAAARRDILLQKGERKATVQR
mmetsp:Transcript_19813/g.48145  ORF Transcript_19813/g.48145 Transcript_19813/m.48145 type:complete len:161 (-) Transcript_19813:50-532(-)